MVVERLLPSSAARRARRGESRARDELSSLLENIGRWPFLAGLARELPFVEGNWIPPVDVYEKPDKYIVKAELPGVKEKDLDISVAEDVLTIKGERRYEEEEEEKDLYRRERAYGDFKRNVTLPSTVDEEKVEATLRDGVLQVELPKTEETRARKVPISARKSG
ncbi:MAG: Hsp20/alpha crystallin family protein [Dehalococcoidia bacterium]